MRKFAFTLTAAVLLGGAVGTAESNDEKNVNIIETKGVLLLANDGVAAVQDADEKSDGASTSDEADKKTEKKVIVEVQSSASSSSDDEGDEKPAKVRGRIIMIGPDGKRKELELDEKQLKTFHLEMAEEGEAKTDSESGSEPAKSEEQDSDEARFEERFVIGVQCEEADDVLRKHLKLDGQGLLVLEVREKTPAAEAGMEVDDIIVAVGDKALKSRDDLVTAVLESEGRELDVRVIRTGDEMTVKVTPKKMKVPVVTTTMDVQGFPLPNMLQDGKVAFPGVVIEGVPQDPKALGKLIEQLQKEALINEKDVLERAKLRSEMDGDVNELRKEVNALKEELEALRKAREDK